MAKEIEGWDAMEEERGLTQEEMVARREVTTKLWDMDRMSTVSWR